MQISTTNALRSLFVLGGMLLLLGCGGPGDSEPLPAASVNPTGSPSAGTPDRTDVVPATLTETPQAGVSPASAGNATAAADLGPEVVVTTNLGELRFRLNSDKAPLTVDNFLTNYVETGFYNGTIIHYVQKDMMAIGGGFDGQLQAKKTRGEIYNEAHNGLKNKKGTIAMARHPDYVHSATSQFFINLADNPALDHVGTGEGQEYGYCVFGELLSGQEVIEKINQSPVKDDQAFVNLPAKTITVQAIRRVK